ncbi:hypothetical protein EII12_10415 [Buchananella hordeovulneris]|uniref:hypothetical protein n=1 Tax=Buchananella hordeovulneris TaxID=52770 RepID=UPI000F5F1CDF|nr:hypothetical protein [Buchananella hordeovulneris]RRD49588.1 hypothetical protein EII12_10415 [Buchananella hordeovulneris]
MREPSGMPSPVPAPDGGVAEGDRYGLVLVTGGDSLRFDSDVFSDALSQMESAEHGLRELANCCTDYATELEWAAISPALAADPQVAGALVVVWEALADLQRATGQAVGQASELRQGCADALGLLANAEIGNSWLLAGTAPGNFFAWAYHQALGGTDFTGGQVEGLGLGAAQLAAAFLPAVATEIGVAKSFLTAAGRWRKDPDLQGLATLLPTETESRMLHSQVAADPRAWLVRGEAVRRLGFAMAQYYQQRQRQHFPHGYHLRTQAVTAGPLGLLPGQPATRVPFVTENHSAPATLAQMAAEVDKAARLSDSNQSLIIAIYENVTVDGQKTYTVIIPGTRDWGFATTNPADGLSNGQLMAGLPSDSYRATVEAMELAGIRPTDPVTLVAHSQGGILASRLAQLSARNGQFRVDNLVTFGGAGGLYQPPAETNQIHLQAADDPVPSLDMVAPAGYVVHAADRRFAPAGSPGHSPHSLQTYEQVGRLADRYDDPGFAAARDKLRVAQGQPGKSRLLLFSSQRVPN